MTVSTQVTDVRSGLAARGLPVRLDRYTGETWEPVAEGETGPDGGWDDATGTPTPGGTHRLRFGTGPYFAARDEASAFPETVLVFTADRPHPRLVLALGAFGYSVHRAP